MEQKACNRWGCVHTHTHTDSFYKKEKNNLIYREKGITKNLYDSIFDFVQKCALCKQ